MTETSDGRRGVDAPTGSPTDAERLRGRDEPTEGPIMHQTWRHLGFLHWPVEREAIARLLPPGLQVDAFEDVAYIGIVPFTIPRSRAARLGLPVAPAFHELNLRTYVHRNGHAPGVWFFSLDAASRLAVAGARVGYGLPYFHARMSIDTAAGPTASGESTTRSMMVTYASRRTGRSAGAEFHGRYGPTGAAQAAMSGTLEFFLIERYLLYSWNGRHLKTARVHHSPYPVQPATTEQVTETVTTAAGLPATTGAPPVVHYAREVDVRIYRPHVAGAFSPR